MVPTLKARIIKEDALRCLSRKFILAESKYVDKTSASKNTRRETKQGLVRKEKIMRNLITQDRRGHANDQIAGGYGSVPLKKLRNYIVKEKSASCLN